MQIGYQRGVRHMVEMVNKTGRVGKVDTGICFITLPSSFYTPSLSSGYMLAYIQKDLREAAPVRVVGYTAIITPKSQ